MFKKIFCVLLCTALLIGVVRAEQTENYEVYYAAEFDDNELPRGTDVTFGEDGYIYAENGALKFEASLTYPPVSTVLFPYKTEGGEYVYECDVKLTDALSESSWLSLCFGAYNDAILYEFTLKYGADASDSVSIRYKNGASSWKTVCASSLYGFVGEHGIDASKFSDGRIKKDASFHLAVAVKSGTAFAYVDGVAVLEGRITGDGDGFVGFNGRGVYFDADNISVNSNLPSGVSAADTYSASLYTPPTGIIEPPLVIQRNKASMPIYSAEGARPAAVLTAVKETGGVLRCYDGAVDLGELSETLDKLYNRILPAFYVSDSQTAAALSVYMRENSLNDAYVIVSRTSLLSEFSDNKYVRFAVDLTSRDGVSVPDVYDMLYSNGVRTVMLSVTAADRDTVFELHKRLISVWVSGTPGTLSLFSAAVNGADAVVTSEGLELISEFGKFENTTLLRRPVVISYGGNSAAAPTDTLKGLVSAFESGIKTALIDVFVTKDNVPVLSQYDVVIGMSEEAVISASTLSYLKTLTYTDGRMESTDRITTLEELFEAVCREYPDTVFHIRVKDVSAESAVVSLANEYGMRQRTVIISDIGAVLNQAKTNSFAAAYDSGPYVFDGRDDAQSVSSLCRVLSEYNSVYYSVENEMPAELLGLVRSRGISAYVTDSPDNEMPVLSGYHGFTLLSSSLGSKLAANLKAECGADGRLTAAVVFCDGTELDVTALCSVISLHGSARLTGGVVSGSGDFVVVCPQTNHDGTKYYVCSNPLSVSEQGAGENTGDQNRPNETGLNTVNVIIIAAASAVSVAGIVVLVIMTHNKRKNTSK